MLRPRLLLLGLVVLPGAFFSGISTYYLIPEWQVLTASYRSYHAIAAAPATSERDLAIAAAAETRHRLNCFAEGVGVLVGGVIWAIGIHGLCTVPRS